ncbi:MAG TPA: parallel beta-helix domain-containing protein [Polyangiaceae bacterium]|nr:parallel beta-helix domain-containing protein [Polyangiaceae bacterium]
MRNQSVARAFAVFSGILLVGLGAACGDSGTTSTGTGGGSTGGGGTGGANPACEGVDTTGCSTVLGPTSDDTTAVQTALIEANSGSTVCLCPGDYTFQNRLSLDVSDVTLKGVGAANTDVVLDFAGQMAGDDGITVTSDGFTIENLSVKNTPGNGVVANGVEGVTFRKLKVYWDAGSSMDNGAYAVYPVKSSNVLIEDCEIVGAADAGLYVGQSSNIIVRNNLVHGNVAGIEIENSTDSEVYGNTSYDNAAGILVFNLPNLEKKDGNTCNVHDNELYQNDRDNFAAPGTIVSDVPPGIGMLILAADNTEVHDNDIHDNKSVGIVMLSHNTLCDFTGGGDSCKNADPATDSYPEGLYVYANTFTDNGLDPEPPFNILGVTPVEDVVWDGDEKTDGSANVCLSSMPPTFRNFNGFANITMPANQSTDPTPYLCEGTKQDPIVLP